VQSGDVTAETAISSGGQIIHEVGTTRMGDDPDTSAGMSYEEGLAKRPRRISTR